MTDSTPSPVSMTTVGEPNAPTTPPPDPVQARIIDLLTADPTRSDRAIAAEAGTEHKRVARVRKKLIAAGRIPSAKQRTGKDGVVRHRSMPKLTTASPPPDAVPVPVPVPDLATGVAADILGGTWADGLHGAAFHVQRQLQPLGRLKRVPAAERGLAAVEPVAAVLTDVAAALAELGRRADAAGSAP